MKFNIATMKEDFEVDEKKQAAADVLFSYSKFTMACIGNQTRPSDMRLHLMKEISGMPTSLKRRESSRAATSPDPVGGESSSTGFTFYEVKSVRASTGKVTCCHFSLDGKMLATAGHDKKAVLWHIDNNMKPETPLEEHTAPITDIRFSPSLPRFATSSFDKTVRVWDADNKRYSLRTFMGHSSIVTSLDFHPIKDDLICSCDNGNVIRYWSINNGSCRRVYKVGSTQMRSEPQIRFQPRVGKYLAASSANLLNVIDVEAQVIRHSLQGHANPITSVCWDPSGDLLASVSEDKVRVWTLGTGSEGKCVHELRCDGNKFQSCVFHPSYPTLLVIGCYQSIELWNLSLRRRMTLSAHEGIIASLAGSATTRLVASASHDSLVKLWK